MRINTKTQKLFPVEYMTEERKKKKTCPKSALIHLTNTTSSKLLISSYSI